MARLIEADALSEELSTLATMITGLRAGKGVLREYMTEYRKSVLRIVDEQPTVDAVPVVHGRWVGKEGLYQGKCSACGYMTYDKTADWARRYWHYCPNCGARMDLKEESDA